MKIKLITVLALIMSVSVAFGQTPIWQGKGRIAISADGNEHDDDDWGATPMTLALLAANGLQDKTSLFIYSDHIWGSNQEEEDRPFGMTPYEHMSESALKGKEYFGFTATIARPAIDHSAICGSVKMPSASIVLAPQPQ